MESHSTIPLFASFSHTGLLVLQRYSGVLLIIIGCHHNWTKPQTDTSTHAYTRHTLSRTDVSAGEFAHALMGLWSILSLCKWVTAKCVCLCVMCVYCVAACHWQAV
jgi:hypothetical protein